MKTAATTEGLADIEAELLAMGSAAQALTKAMVAAGGEVLRGAMETAARAHVRTGAMAASTAVSKIKADKSGASAEVTFEGTDARGVRNAEKAFYLNYGTSRIKADRFVDNAASQAAETVDAAMRAAFDTMKTT